MYLFSTDWLLSVTFSDNILFWFLYSFNLVLYNWYFCCKKLIIQVMLSAYWWSSLNSTQFTVPIVSRYICLSDNELWLHCLKNCNHKKKIINYLPLIKGDVYDKKHGYAIFMHKQTKNSLNCNKSYINDPWLKSALNIN